MTQARWQPPEEGELIRMASGAPQVPDRPVVAFIEGDGTGPDIWRASVRVFDAAVSKAYGGDRKVIWSELLAGAKAFEAMGTWLPEETLEAIATCTVAIKGPLTTPVGGGIRSLNVAIRQSLDLYACVRPARHFPGVHAPVREPEKLDIVIFRENTEDVYSGIEFQAGTPEAEKVAAFLKEQMKCSIRDGSGIGIKPMSREGSERLIRRAIRYALERGRSSVTLMHKGNIMKFTEGAFRQWGYELAKAEFPDQTVTWEQLAEAGADRPPTGKILIKDEIADIMFQKLLLRPEEYDVIATPNLNGDYLSDAAAAQIGGVGVAPGANIGDEAAVFEATHGTAPKYANLDKVNPGSLMLSGVMMFQHMGWDEAADLITEAFARTILQKRVTYDLARKMEGATELKCSQFASAVIENL